MSIVGRLKSGPPPTQDPTQGGRQSTPPAGILPLMFVLDHRLQEVAMSFISNLGLAELVILAAATGLVCGAPLVGMLAGAAFVLFRQDADW